MQKHLTLDFRMYLAHPSWFVASSPVLIPPMFRGTGTCQFCFQGTTWEHSHHGELPYGGDHPTFPNITANSTISSDASPEFVVMKIAGGETRDLSLWSPTYTAFACMFFSALGLYAGFRSGVQYGSARKQSVAYPVV